VLFAQWVVLVPDSMRTVAVGSTVLALLGFVGSADCTVVLIYVPRPSFVQCARVTALGECLCQKENKNPYLYRRTSKAKTTTRS
jgi:hypothetical protein